ncbi:MAG: calcium-binding protein [Pikeienuella sp.]
MPHHLNADPLLEALQPDLVEEVIVDMIVFTRRGDAEMRSLKIREGDETRDHLTGDDTAEVIFGRGGADRIEAGQGDDVIHGGRGFDWINGGHGADSIFGGAGRDILKGKRGNDVLNGGDGRDKLSGGAGNDVLTGGRGADKFIFTNGCGRDTITDFDDGRDLMSFTRHDGVNSFGDLVVTAHEGGTKVSFGVNYVLLEDVNTSEIDASDFIF